MNSTRDPQSMQRTTLCGYYWNIRKHYIACASVLLLVGFVGLVTGAVNTDWKQVCGCSDNDDYCCKTPSPGSCGNDECFCFNNKKHAWMTESNNHGVGGFGNTSDKGFCMPLEASNSFEPVGGSGLPVFLVGGILFNIGFWTACILCCCLCFDACHYDSVRRFEAANDLTLGTNEMVIIGSSQPVADGRNVVYHGVPLADSRKNGREVTLV
jgi:hypothetical protein